MKVATLASLGEAHPRRVIVVGGGYAGITCVVSMGKQLHASDEVELVLVTPHPYQQALTELDLVAAGTPRPQWAELWHGSIFADVPVNVVYGCVDRVSPTEHTVTVSTPEGQATLPYWRLVLATGAVASLPNIPGLREHGLAFWSVDDAVRLQHQLTKRAEEAATLADASARRQALSVLVVGAGATGIEIAGTIADVVPPLIEHAGYDPTEMKVTVLDALPEVLYDLPDQLRAKAVRRMHETGIDLVLGEKLAGIENGIATTDQGRAIPASIVIWCGGVRADPDAVDWGLPIEPSGRVRTTETLAVDGCEDVFAIGDVAAVPDEQTGGSLPMLAQYAIREAAHAANNIIHDLRGEPHEVFHSPLHGEFVSIGPRWGVGWIYGVRLTGRLAIIMKRLTYVMYWLQVGDYRLAWRRVRQMRAMHR